MEKAAKRMADSEHTHLSTLLGSWRIDEPSLGETDNRHSLGKTLTDCQSPIAKLHVNSRQKDKDTFGIIPSEMLEDLDVTTDLLSATKFSGATENEVCDQFVSSTRFLVDHNFPSA